MLPPEISLCVVDGEEKFNSLNMLCPPPQKVTGKLGEKFSNHWFTLKMAMPKPRTRRAHPNLHMGVETQAKARSTAVLEVEHPGLEKRDKI